jgi:asparagine synthetase B (glutamine-hydrolysing)
MYWYFARWGAFRGDGREAEVDIARLRRQVAAPHLVADVPLDAFLSGEPDSGAVVKIASEQRADIRAYIVAFKNAFASY